MEDHQLIVQEISNGSVCMIVADDFGSTEWPQNLWHMCVKKKLCLNWTSSCSVEQDVLEYATVESDLVLKTMITRDECWVYSTTQKTMAQLSQWKSSIIPKT